MARGECVSEWLKVNGIRPFPEIAFCHVFTCHQPPKFDRRALAIRQSDARYTLSYLLNSRVGLQERKVPRLIRSTGFDELSVYVHDSGRRFIKADRGLDILA